MLSTYFTHLAYGILMAYFGLISPGMLNMTALKIRINTNKAASVKFALGASLIVFFQAGLALLFADYFAKNPNVIAWLKILGVFVFFILSIFFFRLSKKKTNAEIENTKGNYFFRGIAMSSINMLAIPFYLGISIYLVSIQKIIIEQPYIFIFVFGASLGSFLLFYTYIFFAKIIIVKVSFIVKNINLILSLLFFILGIITVMKMLP